LTLRTANVNTLPSLVQYAPLIRLRRMALYKSVLIDWLIDCYRATRVRYANKAKAKAKASDSYIARFTIIEVAVDRQESMVLQR